MGSTTVAQVLEEAAALIEPEGAWTQEELAYTAEGEATDGSDKAAVCWCALGSIEQVSGEGSMYEAGRRILAELVGNIPLWNDAPKRTQTEVVSKLREAAAVARERGL